MPLPKRVALQTQSEICVCWLVSDDDLKCFSLRLVCRWDDPVAMGCGSKVAAYTYCTTFVIIVSYAMLNLFVAVVLEQFSEVCNAVGPW